MESEHYNTRMIETRNPPFFLYIYGNWHPCLLGTVKLLMCTFNRQQASTKPYSSASSALPQFLKLSNIIASKGQKFTSHVENSFCKALPPFLDSFDNLPEPLWGWPGKYDCWIVSQSMSSGYEQLILKLIWNVRFLFPLFFCSGSSLKKIHTNWDSWNFKLDQTSSTWRFLLLCSV